MKTAAVHGKMRFETFGLYACALPQGISGFPHPPIPALVTGARAKRDLLEPWVGVLPMIELATFRLEDGRLPEYQEVGGYSDVVWHLRKKPYSAAYYVVG